MATEQQIYPLLFGVALDQQGEVLDTCVRLTLQDGEVLVEPGQENHHLYILMQGSMAAFLTADTTQPGFPILPGESIGEMSIIDGQPVSARVVSVGESHVLAVPEEVFWERLSPLPGVARNLLRMMSKRMRDRNHVMVRAIEQELQLQHLRREMATAGTIQMGMLPHHEPHFPRYPELDVYAMLVPAKDVGGDLYETLQLDDEHILLAVGDVSGKGMPAALFMMRTLTLLRAQAGAGVAPEELLPTLNRLLCENNETDMFVTLYVVILSLYTGRLLLLNGGHNLPLLSRQGAPFEVLNQAKGALLGIMQGAKHRMAETILAPGDRLLLYSDGVTEAENQRQQWYSLERAQALLDACPPVADMGVLVRELAEDVVRFADGAPQSDDITMLGLRMPPLQAAAGAAL